MQFLRRLLIPQLHCMNASENSRMNASENLKLLFIHFKIHSLIHFKTFL